MKSLLSLLFPLLIAQGAMAGPPSAPAADKAEAVSGSNAFAVDLYAQLSKQPGNLFFSPESISTAFGMAYAGARGQTATEMQHVFHFTLPPDRLHPAMGTLLAEMNAPHKGYELRVADALWAQQDSNFEESYLKLVQTDYGAGFRRVNFKVSPDSVRSTINAWVEKQTNDKIKDLLGPGVLTSSTRFVLTNAIYFKGDWEDPFAAEATQKEEFHLSAAQWVMASMMHRTGGYSYYDGGTFQALELPYAGNEISMVVLLPKKIDGLPALEQSFASGDAGEWIRKFEPVDKVILTLPRFTMTQQFELSSALSAMGMAEAFSGAADFSGMDGKPDFTISAAIHKAYIDVNEKGTEAAAATSIVMRATAMQRPFPEPPPIVFRADHPFLFILLDTRSGSMLFLGRVADPTK
ncbi:MAG TPA: serpin family protein [Terracidiphilus sp.]|jgi:serpin B